MKLGISAFAWTDVFEEADLEIMPFVRSCGFQALEIPMFTPRRLPVARVRQAFIKNDLACTVCAILPAGINPIDPERAIRQRQRRILQNVSRRLQRSVRI